jgi:hypothetical protein
MSKDQNEERVSFRTLRVFFHLNYFFKNHFNVLMIKINFLKNIYFFNILKKYFKKQSVLQFQTLYKIYILIIEN